MSNFGLFKVKFGPTYPIFYPNMVKSCKSDLTSGFLDLKVHLGEIFRQIRDKNSTQIWLQKSKFMIFDPIFDPEDGKIMQIWHDQWISRPQKLSWWTFQPNLRKKISERCYKKRNFSKNSVVTKSVVTKSGDFLLQKAYL